MSDVLQKNEPLDRLRELQRLAEEGEVQSDAELLSLYVESGSREAIELLIRRYSPMVASVCRLTVSDASAAEDAFQATFLVLLKSAKKIRKQGSVAAWLHGVAYRSASRIRKKMGDAAKLEAAADTVMNVSSDQEEPIAQVARQMELEALDRELENLPDRIRGPLVEHYLMGYSAPEIAERMELSVTAVEGRLKRGRRTLRSLLARRGISLSVLVAGSAYFQQHVAAAEQVGWADTFLEQHVPSDPSTVQELDIASQSSQVSSLVQGEMAMIGTTGTLKAIAAVGIVGVAGTLAILNATAQESGPTGANRLAGKTTAIEAPTTPDVSPTVTMAALGQVNEPVATGGGGAGALNTPAQLAGAATGGGTLNATEAAAWSPPNDGEVPTWMQSGSEANQRRIRNQNALTQVINSDYPALSLRQICESLSSDLKVNFLIRSEELDLLGVDPDTPVTLQLAEVPVREILRIILDPLELTYRVTESAIEITSKDDAQSEPDIRFYDLSYLLPDSGHAESVLNAIQQSIEPDSWIANGGVCSISLVGSMMIVATTDTTHRRIESFLTQLSRMNPKNQGPTGFGGGMGGGMGGMGGGMF